MPRISVTINGKPSEVPPDLTIAGLLRHLEVPSLPVAVERNECLVRRTDWETAPVESGDRFEVVTFVGGG